MSRLALYCPPETVAVATSRRHPMILSFVDEFAKRYPGRRPTRWVDAICPDCNHDRATVITLNDDTVVGNCCGDCGREWPVIPRAEGVG